MPPPRPLPSTFAIPALSLDDARLLIESVVDYAIFMLDADGYVATWNPGARSAKGYEPSEIIGKHFSVFYTAADRDAGRPQEILDTVRRVGRCEDLGWRVRKDGTRFWADVVITALRNEAGEVTGFAKVTRDLTERRRAEEELRSSEERFRFLVDSLSDHAIFMLDPEGRVTSWNPAAERMKGYLASEIIGRDFAVFFPDEDIRQGKPGRELAAARETSRFEDEGWRVRKDGTLFWANVVLNAVHDSTGVLRGYAKITRDLTARREAEKTERTLLAAQEASRIKDEFLATVSHELRTPLNAIVGWAAMLRQRPLEPNVAKGIEVIDRNAKAQVKIVEDILDVSRIITGKLRIEPKPTDLVALARDAVEVIRPSAAAKEIAVELVDDADMAVVVADPERLQQALWNLLSNAVKFTQARGSVRISIRREASSLVLDVSDTGVGIEPEFLPFAFERFKQADGSTTRRYGGLGLGLALVRHIVELHGGTVAAESEGPGKGSTFRIMLPLRAVTSEPAVAPHTPRPATPPLPAPRDALAGIRVLVVDDEDDARELLEAVLTSAGAAVEKARSAETGIRALQRFRPHVVVSDIAMPGEDGYSFGERLRTLPAAEGGGVPAIALTAYTREEDRERAMGAGFATHLGKPISAEDLITTVAGLVDRG